MANHLFLLSLVAALTLPGLILAQNDTTRQPGTSGADVVKAAVHVLREKCVFPNDHLFLRRLAYVLTEDGTDPSTYRPGYDGGIWKVDNDTFHLTLKIVNDDLFEEAFGITWSQVTWDELRKPLYSVIAASLYVISHTPNGQFPVTEDEQAALYHSLFGGSASDFKKNITSLDTECESDNLDIVFILDASGSIDDIDFEKAKHFTADVISKFDVAQDKVRVALLSYSSDVTTHFNFSVYNSSSSAKNAVLRIPKISGGTSTWLALDEAADTLFSNTSTRPGASRVAVLATDGYSSLSMTNASAERLKSKDVSVFAIGVGSGTNLQELNAIASTPKCIHMRELSGFSELASIITDIKEESCKAAAVQKEGSNNTYSCQKETAFSLDVQNGYSVVVRPDSGHVDIYGSFSTSLPSAALSDFSSEAKSNRPVILFIEEKGNERKIYLTVSSSPNKTGDCQSYFELVVYTKNVLSLEVPLVPLCAINGTANACDILTIIKGQLNIGNKTANTTATTSSDTTILPENQTSPFPNTSSPHIKPTAPATPTPSTTHIPCPGSGPGVYAHPVSKTSYVACAEDGSVYVFQCPAGLSFTVKERRCSTPIIDVKDPSDEDSLCKICTETNWRFGLRNFALPNNATAYIACDYIDMCSVRNCGGDSLWGQDQQSCYVPVIPPIDLLMSSALYPCGRPQTVKILPFYKASAIIQPASGTVEIFGSFSNNRPSASNFDFQGLASDVTPAIFYVRDATGPMYLTVGGGSGSCSGFVNVTRLDGNALHKFGAENTCLFQHIDVPCSDYDFLEKYNYIQYRIVDGDVSGLHFPNPCQIYGSPFHAYPFSQYHFIFCEGNHRLLEVDCPLGSHYLDAAQDCVLDTHLDAQHPCQVCHSDNWHLNRRTFNFPGEQRKYISCTGVDKCVVKNCGTSYAWDQWKQACEYDNPLVTVVPMTTSPSSAYRCQPHTGGSVTYYSYTGDATKFVQCNAHGHAYVLSCPPGEIWNQHYLSCRPAQRDMIIG